MMDPSMSASRVWDVLAAAQASYLSEVSPHYDEVFWDVAGRVEAEAARALFEFANIGVFAPLIIPA